VIRKCKEEDTVSVYSIINDAAKAYKGVIPEDRYSEPYMSMEELRHEIKAGVIFWGVEELSELVGVMGVQSVLDVSLIRHAYVKSLRRNKGIGTLLLNYLLESIDRPVLIGTWADAAWAIRFYEHHGFRLIPSNAEKDRLLKKYWNIPERQVETSVVLADQRFFSVSRRQQTAF